MNNNPDCNIQLPVTTRRSAGFYFAIFFSALFFFGLFGAGLLAIAFDDTPPNYILILVSLALTALGVYSIYVYYKNVPTITADNSGLHIRGRYYHWDDIAELFFTGKQPFRYIGNYPMEGAMILFRDGTKRYLFDGMYTNLWKIKAAIRQSLEADSRYGQLLADAGYAPGKTKERRASVDMTSTVDSSSQNFRYFKGSQFTSFRGIVLWGGLFFMVFIMIALDSSAATVLLCIVCTGWFLLWSFMLNYFGVSEEYLVIRNHNFFWKRKLYLLSDIDRVVFDSPNNNVNALTLMLNTMQTKTYPGPTLRPANWIALKKLLESKGIRLKDENSFVEMEKPAMKKATRKMYLYIILYYLASMALYLYFTSLNVSEGIMILLKLLWVLILIVGIVFVMKLVVRAGGKAQKDDENSVGDA